MSDLSNDDFRNLDIILYLQTVLGSLLDDKKAEELNKYINEKIQEEWTPVSIAKIMISLCNHEKLKSEINNLKTAGTRSYSDAELTGKGFKPIPLGPWAKCPMDSHPYNNEYKVRLRYSEQHCPYHNVKLIPIEE